MTLPQAPPTTPPPTSERVSPSPEGAVAYLRVIAFGVVLATIVLFAVVMHQLASVAQPFFVALLLCFIIAPAADGLQRFKVPRPVGYAVSAGGIFLLMYLVGQLVALNTDGFVANLPTYREHLSGYLSQLNAWLVELRLLTPETPLNLKTIDAWIPPNALASVLGGGTSVFFSFVGSLVIVIFFAVFILLEAAQLPARIRHAYGPERAAGILSAIAEINGGIRRYLAIKVLVSALIGALATIILALFGVDFFYLFGALTFLLNFIPYLGSILATLLPGVMALVQFGSLLDVFWLLLSLTAAQLAVGNVLEPQVQGKNLNLSPLLILVSLAFWGWMWGVVGMLLAVPITVTVRIAMEHSPRLRTYAILLSHHVRGQAQPVEGAADGSTASQG